MKVLIQKHLFLGILLTSISFASCSLKEKSGQQAQSARPETLSSERNAYLQRNHPKDMVLIYDGGAHRNIVWNSEHFAPYVSYTDQQGVDKWLFDGFLFLEFKDGRGRCFASYYEKQGARKTEWEALADNYFRDGNAVVALDERIQQVLSRTGQTLPSKRKVVLCLPEPIPDQKDWGEIDQQVMDFTKRTDRLKACQWYVDYAVTCFDKAALEHLDLVGFYWIAEEATNSRDLAKDVSDYVHHKGYNFYWIPYFKSDGHAEWKTLGFDKAYYQPNYFFKEDVPISQIEEACQTAIENGMSMEMEFDERALEQRGWGYRLEDYMNVFRKYGVLDSMDIAYYQGGDAFYRLHESKNSKDNKLYNKLSGIIAGRQNQD